MIVYNVIAYRYGEISGNQFPLGVFSNLEAAKAAAIDYKQFRGGKYESIVYKYTVDVDNDTPEIAWKTRGMG